MYHGEAEKHLVAEDKVCLPVVSVVTSLVLPASPAVGARYKSSGLHSVMQFLCDSQWGFIFPLLIWLEDWDYFFLKNF